MAAFERAVGLGYTHLETDVRVTSDGVALAFHDSVLDRVTDMRGRIAELPWATVRHARIRGREPIPLLADLLTAWPHTLINLDVKATPTIGPAIDAIRRTGTLERVCVAAFSHRRVVAVRRALGPDVCTALTPREAFALRLAPPRRGRRHGGVRCAQVPDRVGRVRLVDHRFVAAAHARGLQVHVWTINERADMQRLLDLGVDGIMTDAADVLKQLLVERGQWVR
jgi:glycerophosphoryl diester phosphodiesterase